MNADQLQNRVRAHLNESAEIKRQVAEVCMESILAAAVLLEKAFRSGGKVLLCGNGGSAADCQHLAAEFVNRLTKSFERPALPAIALTTDTSFLTAYTNDYGVEGLFARQVQALGKKGDVLIGISTSGNSANIIQAVKTAKIMGIHTIALMGTSGKLMELADVAIAVPSNKIQYIQESHIAIEHILCMLVEYNYYDSQQ